MPVRVNEFVIQAKFDCGGSDANPESGSESGSMPAASLNDDLLAMKDEIISECLEKFEALLQKREGR